MHKLLWGIYIYAMLFLNITGCKPKDESDIDSFILPKTTTKLDPGYIYKGAMPRLKDIEMFISMNGRTLRVEGVPIDGKEKFESIIADINDETKNKQEGRYLYPRKSKPPPPATLSNFISDIIASVVTPIAQRYFVVYPIAIGKSVTEDEGNYQWERIIPRRASDEHSWHGLPFMGYAGARDGSIAFHSPITAANNGMGVAKQGQLLELYRGKVSKGCKRMQAEHILELSHIFSVNTVTTLASGEADKDNILSAAANLQGIKVKGFIHSSRKFDEVDDFIVDVDYPKYGDHAKPPANKVAHVFNSWDLSNAGKENYVCYFEKAAEAEKTCKALEAREPLQRE